MALEPQQLRLEAASPAGAFERRLNELHEMLYRRGGIRPVNAALEELAKVLLLQLQNARNPNWIVPGHGRIRNVLDPAHVRAEEEVAGAKEAFRQLVALSEFAGRLPDGGLQGIWPADEPLRIDRADVLAEALEVMDPKTIGASSMTGFDMLGTAFDVFLRGRYDHAGGLATYLTPHSVATMLAHLALADVDLLEQPIDGPVVGDPCCGTGRFLIAAVHDVLCREAATAHDDRRGRLTSLLENGLFGADQSSSSVAKARVNLLLFGVHNPYVFTVRDSITDRSVGALRGRLRIILTNPPFGEGKYDASEGIARTRERLPTLRQRTRIDPATAFLVRCLDLLRDGGRLGIVLPDGILDSRAIKDALLRHGETRWRDVSVEANVSLPTATFALSGTVAKTSTLLLRKGGKTNNAIFLARADHVGYVKQGGVAVADRDGDDLPVIAELGAGAMAKKQPRRGEAVLFLSERPLAAVVEYEDITTLDPARLDPHAFEAREHLRSTEGLQLVELLVPVSRRGARREGDTPFVSVLHVDELGVVAWHKAREYRPSTPGQRADPEELLFSLLNPRQMRATVVPAHVGQVLCSAEFGVFQPSIDPYRVLALLHDPRVRAQLAPLGRGTSSSRRRIEPEDLLEVYVPRIADDRLGKIAALLRSNLENLVHSADAVADAYDAVSPSDPDSTVEARSP